MDEEKKDRRKMPKFIVIILIILLCIALYFPLSILVKRIILYNECSNIEEYRTREIVDDPEDYDMDVDNIILWVNLYYFSKEENYHLYLFDDGRIFSSSISNNDCFGNNITAIENGDNESAWNNVELTYQGRMSGRDLFNILVLREKADFSAERYDYDVEYQKAFDMIEDPRETPLYSDLDPWITVFCMVDKNDYYFFQEANDGIRYYLFDENAQEMLRQIEDSWYFDQWMTDIYGDDWRSKVTIYRSEEDFAFRPYK